MRRRVRVILTLDEDFTLKELIHGHSYIYIVEDDRGYPNCYFYKDFMLEDEYNKLKYNKEFADKIKNIV